MSCAEVVVRGERDTFGLPWRICVVKRGWREGERGPRVCVCGILCKEGGFVCVCVCVCVLSKGKEVMEGESVCLWACVREEREQDERETRALREKKKHNKESTQNRKPASQQSRRLKDKRSKKA